MPMWSMRRSPVPLHSAERYTPVDWPVAHSIALPLQDVTWPTMSKVLASRRTRRDFAPMPLSLLSTLLWHTMRTQSTSLSPMNLVIEHRPVPSAGAIHPIHLILELAEGQGWSRYNSQEHSLDVLSGAPALLDSLATHCEKVVARGTGQLALFVAEPGKTNSKYADGESLVWRDAGIVQGVLSLAAEALDLNFCLLGVTGDPWAQSLSEHGKLQGVGVAIVGARP